MALIAFGSDDDGTRGLRAGYDYYLTKPLDFTPLRCVSRGLTNALGGAEIAETGLFAGGEFRPRRQTSLRVSLPA